MQNFQKIISILFLTITSLNFASPVKAQNYLNVQLRDALCRQNWAAAIAVIDRMKQVAPSYIPQLNAYRATLVNLRNSRARLVGWPAAAYCAGEIPTNNPTNTQNNNNPNNTPANPQNNTAPNNQNNIPNPPPTQLNLPVQPSTNPQNNQNTPNQNRTVPTLNQGNVG